MKEQTRGRTRRKVLQAIGTGALLGGVGTFPRTVSASDGTLLHGYHHGDVRVGNTVTLTSSLLRYEQFCYDPFVSSRYDAVSTDVDGRTIGIMFSVEPSSHPAEGFSPGDTFEVVTVHEFCSHSNYRVDYKRSTANTAPTAAFTYSPSDPEIGEEITFNASESDDLDGSINAFEWNFGDGSTGSGEIVTHEYTEDGDYTVTLTVTDNDNVTDTTAQTVSVVVFADPLEVNGNTYLPKDSDGDGLFEDIDGDGTVGTGADTSGLAQIIEAYQEGSLDLTDAQTAALDFNGDGSLTGQDNGAYNRMYK